MRIIATLALYASLALQTALGAPWPAVKHQNVEGTLVAFTWVGAFHYQEEEVWPVVNNVGVRETGPHYYLLLSKTNLSEKQRNELTQYSLNANFSPKICGRPLEDDEVIVLVASHRIKDFKTGSKVGLTGYEIRADEFTSWTSHQGFLVDGAKPKEGRQDGNDAPASDEEDIQAEQNGADQPATAPESKPDGDSEPQPESEGRPQ